MRRSFGEKTITEYVCSALLSYEVRDGEAITPIVGIVGFDHRRNSCNCLVRESQNAKHITPIECDVEHRVSDTNNTIPSLGWYNPINS